MYGDESGQLVRAPSQSDEYLGLERRGGGTGSDLPFYANLQPPHLYRSFYVEKSR